MPRTTKSTDQFVLCVSASEPDLEPCKIYRTLEDASAKRSNYIRVIDESGEDYLYPEKYFVAIHLPKEAKRAVARALKPANKSPQRTSTRGSLALAARSGR